jgi:hypothetical protein
MGRSLWTNNGSVTLDESLGLQNSGIPAGAEDNNDSDVSLATLQSTVATFYNRLFGAGGLGLSTTFATSNGVAESASNFITVSGGTVASLGFVDGDGNALPAYAGIATGGVATGLSAVNGGRHDRIRLLPGRGLLPLLEVSTGTRQRRRWSASRKAGLPSMPSALALMFAKPTLMSFAQYGTTPERAKSRIRSPALASKRTIGSWSVGAPFQLGAKFGVGRCGGMEKTSLISLMSEERRTRPHIGRA